jgi:hypothetical protein
VDASYEFLISINNAALTLSSTLSTQLQAVYGVQRVATEARPFCDCARDEDALASFTWLVFAIEARDTGVLAREDPPPSTTTA